MEEHPHLRKVDQCFPVEDVPRFLRVSRITFYENTFELCLRWSKTQEKRSPRWIVLFVLSDFSISRWSDIWLLESRRGSFEGTQSDNDHDNTKNSFGEQTDIPVRERSSHETWQREIICVFGLSLLICSFCLKDGMTEKDQWRTDRALGSPPTSWKWGVTSSVPLWLGDPRVTDTAHADAHTMIDNHRSFQTCYALIRNRGGSLPGLRPEREASRTPTASANLVRKDNQTTTTARCDELGVTSLLPSSDFEKTNPTHGCDEFEWESKKYHGQDSVCTNVVDKMVSFVVYADDWRTPCHVRWATSCPALGTFEVLQQRLVGELEWNLRLTGQQIIRQRGPQTLRATCRVCVWELRVWSFPGANGGPSKAWRPADNSPRWTNASACSARRSKLSTFLNRNILVRRCRSSSSPARSLQMFFWDSSCNFDFPNRCAVECPQNASVLLLGRVLTSRVFGRPKHRF